MNFQAEQPDKTPTPSLPPNLAYVYNSLPSNYQRLFVKIFRWMWSYVLNKRSYLRRSGVLYYFWAVDTSRLSLGLTTSELAVLSYIYQLTNIGSTYIHSDLIYNSVILPNLKPISKLNVLKCLKRKGYISRSYRDPSAPYLSRSFASHPVFITLTSSGVAMIKGIERDLYKLLYNTSLNEITGANKKTDPITQDVKS